jgi:hypothetical protein
MVEAIWLGGATDLSRCRADTHGGGIARCAMPVSEVFASG